MQRTHHNDLVYYQFEALSAYSELAHGVFARKGGVSPAPFDSLNVGSTVGDELSNVLENRARIADVMAVLDQETRTTWQVHGADVLVVRSGDPQLWPPPKADGVICADSVPLVMRFADCVPVVLYDPVRRVVGLAHAGWRGTVAGATPATVRAMADTFGTQADDIIAGIGPSIGPCCYEVGPEVIAEVQRAFHGGDGLVRPGVNGRGAHLDLWAANARALRDSGVHRIEISEMCTSCRVDEFFSHRRERGKTGRFGVLIALREQG